MKSKTHQKSRYLRHWNVQFWCLIILCISHLNANLIVWSPASHWQREVFLPGLAPMGDAEQIRDSNSACFVSTGAFFFCLFPPALQIPFTPVICWAPYRGCCDIYLRAISCPILPLRAWRINLCITIYVNTLKKSRTRTCKMEVKLMLWQIIRRIVHHHNVANLLMFWIWR